MNIVEARQKLKDHDIHQLNHGETLADALEYVENGGIRKGYKIKADNGRTLTKNEVIQHENSVAFHKFTPAEFHANEVDEIDDIPDGDDYRDNKKERGVIINCYYCGTCIRVDSGFDGDEDYPEPMNTIHCEGCMKDAISRLAM